jgi:hypothetical protein
MSKTRRSRTLPVIRCTHGKKSPFDETSVGALLAAPQLARALTHSQSAVAVFSFALLRDLRVKSFDFLQAAPKKCENTPE